MRIPFTAVAVVLLLVASPGAFAARPFNTDDARIVDPDGYQIEAYVKGQRGVKQTEYWFLPAHNFGGALDRFEFTLGGNLFRSDENGNSNSIIGQVKTLLKPLETNGIGFALTLGVTRFKPGTPGAAFVVPIDPADPTAAGGTSTEVAYNPYVNGISSVSVFDDAFVFHFNAGAIRDNVDKTTIGSWGVGAEIRVTDRWFGMAETYGLSNEKPAYQVGVRFWAIPGNLQIDSTYGWQHSSPANLRWVSVGVRILW
jgi:hypothetical protein